ncbi:MAG: hypothetical protein KBC27_03675 [Rickettsiales bacterium]|nr:hypothetical protein [Rickettsiales bacterium]
MIAIALSRYSQIIFLTLKVTSVATYFAAIRPLAYTAITDFNDYITTTDINPDTDNPVVSFLKTHKTSVSIACTATTELLLPLGDFYLIQNLAINSIAISFDIKKLNSIFENRIIIHLSPVVFRSTSILLELSDQCKKQEISTIKEMPIRASEFTSWYYFLNFYLQNKISNKLALALTNKLLAIYLIRVFDQLEYQLLEQSTRPLISAQLILPPLFKSPVTTLCKLSIDALLQPSWTQQGFEVSCNFLGELSYHHVEGYLKNNTSLLSFNTNTSHTFYLLAKSIWKTAHQSLEKDIASPEELDKPLGYRVMAFFAPRNYITKRLKTVFATKDSSDYLDPDLVELSDLIGVRHISIKSTDNLLLMAQANGACLSSPRIESKILNITNNLWGWRPKLTNEKQEEIMRCTASKFYSENQWQQPYLDIDQKTDFAALNLATKRFLNSSAETCLMESREKENTIELGSFSFADTFDYLANVATSYLNSWFTFTDPTADDF